MQFANREDAGKRLARALVRYKKREGVIVYALPRGGVIPGWEVAKYLRAPLDLIITRKIGHPSSPEYAMCAVTESGELICNEEERVGVDKAWLARAVKNEQQEAKRRRTVYFKGRTPIPASGKTAIIVDDGAATGLTMLLAARELKRQHAKKTVAAVPVIPADTAEKLRKEVDELVALEIPTHFLGAIGSYYDEFPQVEDDKVMELLEESSRA